MEENLTQGVLSKMKDRLKEMAQEAKKEVVLSRTTGQANIGVPNPLSRLIIGQANIGVPNPLSEPIKEPAAEPQKPDNTVRVIVIACVLGVIAYFIFRKKAKK